MDLLSVEDVKLNFTDMLNRWAIHGPGRIVPPKREPGWHLSGILRYIAVACKYLKDDDAESDPENPIYPLLWALGVMWEEFAASLYPEMLWQPGTVAIGKDKDIWCSPDGLKDIGISVQPALILEEFKFTYKRARTGEEFLREWLYIHQGIGYCEAYNVQTVRYHTLFIKGDYKTFGPVYRRYTIRFTEKEIRQVVEMLDNNKESVEKEMPLAA